MQYNSYIPTKLNDIVEQIWEIEIPFQSNLTLLPSGKVELLFPLCRDVDISANRITASENPVRNCTSFLSGLHTKPLKMTFDGFHMFGVQMKPVAVKAIFGMPLCEIRNYFVEGKYILGDIGFMEEQLHSKANFMERAQWFENFLLKRINETPDLHLAIRLEQALKKHINQKGNGSKKSIEDMMGYSRTQTYRLFNMWFGTSSHSYLKLLQFIRAVESLHDPSVRLVDAGHANGYYDQSHFIRTFQDFAEITPGEYRKLMSSLPGQLFSEP